MEGILMTVRYVTYSLSPSFHYLLSQLQGDVTKISNDVVNSIINKGIDSLTSLLIFTYTLFLFLGMNNSVNNLVNDSNIVEGSDYLKNHYAIPPTTLESLRKRYGIITTQL